MGASPGFLMACRKEGVEPATEFDLSRLRQIGAAGQPAAAGGLPLGGRAVRAGACCSTWAAAAPTSAPASCRAARCSRCGPARSPARAWASTPQAFDENGKPVVGELGELVITAPMPSMPVGFWGDADGSPLPRHLLRHLARRLAARRLGALLRGRQRDHRRPLGRHPEPGRGAAGHRRVLPRRRGAAGGRRQPRGAPGGPGRRQRGAAALRAAARPGVELDDALRRRIATALRDRSCRRGTSPTGSSPCRRCRATGPGRSWSCRSRRSCSGPRPDEVASRDVLADPTALDAFVSPATGDRHDRPHERRGRRSSAPA